MTQPSEPPPPRKRRGAQPKNKNALKHGLYSLQMQASERKDLQAFQSLSLLDEIAMLRLCTRRLFVPQKIFISSQKSIHEPLC